MDCLPLEIIANIALYLPKWLEDNGSATDAQLVRPAIASLSRKWQFSVEPAVFREIKLKSTELDEFASVFSTSQSHRRRLLKILVFNIVLPTYSDDDCAMYETDPDRLANSKAASEAVTALFDVLSRWGSNSGAAIDLCIAMHSPMDNAHRGMDKYEQDRADSIIGRSNDIFEERYRCSYIRILDPDKLPVAPCIKSLAPHGGERRFHPSALVTLTAKAAPALERVLWQYSESDVYLALRREMRNEFVQSLKTFRLGPSARAFAVYITSHNYQDKQRLPNLVFPHRLDPLCSALHRMVGNNVEKLYYTGQIDPSFFWPYAEGEDPDLFWSSVDDLIVEFDMASPCGRWYFRGRPDDEFNVPASDEPLPPETVGHKPPGYSSAEETQAALVYERSMQPVGREGDGTFDSRDDFRRVPNDEVMVPMLEAFARAAAQMRALTSVYLATRVKNITGDNGEWFVSYLAPGKASGFEEYIMDEDAVLSKPRVFFHVLDWRPSKELVDLFRIVGRERHQQDAIITFLPWLY